MGNKRIIVRNLPPKYPLHSFLKQFFSLKRNEDGNWIISNDIDSLTTPSNLSTLATQGNDFLKLKNASSQVNSVHPINPMNPMNPINPINPVNPVSTTNTPTNLVGLSVSAPEIETNFSALILHKDLLSKLPNIQDFELIHPSSYTEDQSELDLRNAYATITFKTEKACMEFYYKYQDHKLPWFIPLKSKEIIYNISIEYAPYQISSIGNKISNSKPNKEEGKIFSNKYYLMWLNQEGNESDLVAASSGNVESATLKSDDSSQSSIDFEQSSQKHTEEDRKLQKKQRRKEKKKLEKKKKIKLEKLEKLKNIDKKNTEKINSVDKADKVDKFDLKKSKDKKKSSSTIKDDTNQEVNEGKDEKTEEKFDGKSIQKSKSKKNVDKSIQSKKDKHIPTTTPNTDSIEIIAKQPKLKSKSKPSVASTSTNGSQSNTNDDTDVIEIIELKLQIKPNRQYPTTILTRNSSFTNGNDDIIEMMPSSLLVNNFLSNTSNINITNNSNPSNPSNPSNTFNSSNTSNPSNPTTTKQNSSNKHKRYKYNYRNNKSKE